MIIVVQSFGRGKVLALTTDQSWRLRYRVGDTRHHRFWGQIIRWGLGERLRDGTPQLRVGTDRITYAPNEPVALLARVLNDSFAAVNNARPTATLRTVADGETGKVFRGNKFSDWMYDYWIPRQMPDGRWDVGEANCPYYQTALVVLAFTVPYRQLPTYRRDETVDEIN